MPRPNKPLLSELLPNPKCAFCLGTGVLWNRVYTNSNDNMRNAVPCHCVKLRVNGDFSDNIKKEEKQIAKN
jgi:hypothetical protein